MTVNVHYRYLYKYRTVGHERRTTDSDSRVPTPIPESRLWDCGGSSLRGCPDVELEVEGNARIHLWDCGGSSLRGCPAKLQRA